MFPHPLIHDELARQRSQDLQTGVRNRRDARPGEADLAAHELTDLVRRARLGDPQAWEGLVERLTPALRATARSYRLNAADVDDAVQSAWVAAVRHIDKIREPEAIAGWMLVTVRREALRILRAHQGELPVAELPERITTDEPQPVTGLLESERGEALRAAVESLPVRQRALMHALIRQPEPSYDEVAKRLSIPVGSIGPTRQRALVRLRRNRELAAVASEQSGATA
jgi:RNA polymerase sigma factor (sigma-70 family)